MGTRKNDVFFAVMKTLKNLPFFCYVIEKLKRNTFPELLNNFKRRALVS